jgi:hypothetical protein
VPCPTLANNEMQPARRIKPRQRKHVPITIGIIFNGQESPQPIFKDFENIKSL